MRYYYLEWVNINIIKSLIRSAFRYLHEFIRF